MSKTFREAYRELESRPVPDERLMVAGPDRAEEQRVQSEEVMRTNSDIRSKENNKTWVHEQNCLCR